MNTFAKWGVLFAAMALAFCNPPENQKSIPPAGTRVQMRHAKGLQIIHAPDGYEVRFRNPQDTTQIYGSLLLSRKTFATKNADTVTIPVARAALGSTTFGAYFHRIGQADAIGAITYTDRVQNAILRNLIETGHIKDITDSNGIDFERLLMAEPDVFMGYVYADGNFDRYREQGIPVAINMEYQEPSPLARAEWVLLAGALTDQLEAAIEVFSELEQNYLRTASLAQGASPKPSVFTGTRYGSDWFAPGNKSYIAQFIRDAGATYAFEHVEGQGNAQLDFESVVSVISQADYWGLLVSSSTEFTTSDILKMGEEYALSNAVKKGQVFVCNTAHTDYFGDAVMQPDVILSDLVAILHPSLLSGHAPTYFFPVVADVSL